MESNRYVESALRGRICCVRDQSGARCSFLSKLFVESNSQEFFGDDFLNKLEYTIIQW